MDMVKSENNVSYLSDCRRRGGFTLLRNAQRWLGWLLFRGP